MSCFTTCFSYLVWRFEDFVMWDLLAGLEALSTLVGFGTVSLIGFTWVKGKRSRTGCLSIGRELFV